MSGSSAIRTLPELLAFACAAYGRQPSDELLDSWKGALGSAPIRQLYEALIAHQRNTSSDPRDGRPAGRWFPLPADLLFQIEAKERREKAQLAQKYVYCGSENCNSGWVNAGENAHGDGCVSRCPNCEALWASLAPVGEPASRRSATPGARQV